MVDGGAQQVVLADRLVLSKIDLADARAVERLIEAFARAQPARHHSTTAIDGDLDPRCLIEAGGDAAKEPVKRSGFVAEAEHSDGISSFVLTPDAPLAWDAFTRAMETLIALRGPDLLRVKGLLDVAGCRGPVVVQIVQHLAHPPVELASWPDGNRSKSSRLHHPQHLGAPGARPAGGGAGARRGRLDSVRLRQMTLCFGSAGTPHRRIGFIRPPAQFRPFRATLRA